MDFMQEAGSLALGARLRRLGDSIGQEINQIYKSQETGFEARWFPFFQLLSQQSPLSTVEIADRLGVKHPSVNAIMQELKDQGFIGVIPDTNDKRRFLLELTPAAKRLYNMMENIWRDLRQASDELIQEADMDVFKALLALETALKNKSLAERFKNVRLHAVEKEVRIRAYEPSLKQHFVNLNGEWIDKYFGLEDPDRKTLAEPDKYILKKGGFVFFAEVGDEIIGTCALLKRDDSTYELAKMRVDERFQGRKIGRRLVDACITQAKECGAKKIVLETNSVLNPAIKLYTNAGFKHETPASQKTGGYKRGDTFMRLEL
jgi:GNAT superfamily N-acetyltransferase/DNA-binding MarR family transcriptional regulator